MYNGRIEFAHLQTKTPGIFVFLCSANFVEETPGGAEVLMVRSTEERTLRLQIHPPSLAWFFDMMIQSTCLFYVGFTAAGGAGSPEGYHNPLVYNVL